MTDIKTAETKTEAGPQIVRPEPTPKLPAKAALRGGGSISPIVPQDFEQAYRMAEVIAAAGMAPKSFMMKDPTDLKEYLSVPRITLAIMAGLEVGLMPLQAIQGIAVINGMPTIYADAQDALVEASGLLEDRVEEHELDGQGLFLWYRCTVWRRGRKTPVEVEVTRAQASRAGWLKKQGPWQESPNRMAQRRARGWAYRDAFPDVLKGLVDRDEALEMVDVTRADAATTAPPAPRRSDYVHAATDVADQNVGDAANGGDGGHDPEAGEVHSQDVAKKSWKLAESIIGQQAKLAAIHDLLSMAEIKSEVDDIEAEHKSFIDKLGMKKAETVRAFADRKAELPDRAAE